MKRGDIWTARNLSLFSAAVSQSWSCPSISLRDIQGHFLSVLNSHWESLGLVHKTLWDTLSHCLTSVAPVSNKASSHLYLENPSSPGPNTLPWFASSSKSNHILKLHPMCGSVVLTQHTALLGSAQSPFLYLSHCKIIYFTRCPVG